MEGAKLLTGAVTQFFSIQLRKDRSPPPPPRKASSQELTAGTPELDTLLRVHLQVCRTLLQVARGCGGRGRLLGSWAGARESSLQRADPAGGGEHSARKRAREAGRLVCGRFRPG